jgi:hypothetical protein
MPVGPDGHGSSTAGGLRLRDSLGPQYSQERLTFEVRLHHLGHAADSRIARDLVPIRSAFFQPVSESVKGDIQSNLLAKLEKFSDGLCEAVGAKMHALDEMFLDS